MSKFKIFIRGVNFHMRIDSDDIEPWDFYVTAYVEAESSEAAEYAGIDLLRASPKLRKGVHNSPDDPPRMFVEEIEELAQWPTDCVLPLSGFAFYNEKDDNKPNETESPNA